MDECKPLHPGFNAHLSARAVQGPRVIEMSCYDYPRTLAATLAPTTTYLFEALN